MKWLKKFFELFRGNIVTSNEHLYTCKCGTKYRVDDLCGDKLSIHLGTGFEIYHVCWRCKRIYGFYIAVDYIERLGEEKE